MYFEGSKCPLGKRGSRDDKRSKLQIVFALLCDREGCPVAAEVFRGNTADPGAVADQVETLRRRFSLSRVVLVGDRGLLTDPHIREDLSPAGLRWITALRAPKIHKLVSGGDLQLSLFDERDLRRSPRPRSTRAGGTLSAATRCSPPSGPALYGVYVIRTNVPANEIGPEDAVRAYKSLSRVARASRCFKGVDFKVRPVHHRLEDSVCARVLLCMLAYHVDWHTRRALAPCSSTTETRPPPRSPARRSPSARAKAGGKRTPDGLPSTDSRPCPAISSP